MSKNIFGLVALVKYIETTSPKLNPRSLLSDSFLALKSNPSITKGNIFRFFERKLSTSVYKNPESASLIDYWLDYTDDNLSTADFKPFVSAMKIIDNHLTLRSFMVGHDISVADFAIWGALRGAPGFQKLINANKNVGINLRRWYDHITSLDFVQSALQDPLILSSQQDEKIGKSGGGISSDQGKFDIALKDAELGKVVTRFPPEPSGYLHIGHIKAALLNDYFAKHYKGKMLLRFDDTNPSKEKEEFSDSIMADLKKMEIKWDSLSHTSDHFEKIYTLTLQLIKCGLAYVDDTTQEQMRAERMDGIESKNRNMSVDDTLLRFQEMKDGTDRGLLSCLRAKIDMQAKNKTLRDPVIYRCNLIPHIRTGSAWKVYPTYDLCCPIVDSIEGVTHALRTNEYRDRNAQYEWFLKALKMRHVHLWDFSRVNFVYTLLSKRKLAKFVDTGVVGGWDDPRFPTIRGILRRGLTVEALRTYMLMQGASQKELMLEWDKIWALNKKLVDPTSPRHTALNRVNIVKVKLINYEDPSHIELKARHKKNPELGEKETTFSSEIYLEFDDAKDLEIGEEVTLMDWGNAIVKTIEWVDTTKTAGKFISLIEMDLFLEGDFKKTKRKLTWLSRRAPVEKPDFNLSSLLLIDYDYLITKKKLEEGDDVDDFVTPVSEFHVDALGDANIINLKKSDIIQLERKGLYIVDTPYDPENPSKQIRLILVPDGKEKSMASKAGVVAPVVSVVSAASSKPKKAVVAQSNGVVTSSGYVGMYPITSIYGKIETLKFNGMYQIDPLVDNTLDLTPSKSIAKPQQKAKPAQTPTDTPSNTADPTPSAAPKKKKQKTAVVAPPPDTASPLSKLDIVVGKIVSVKKHPDAESLYIEQIDIGESTGPREIVSGLVKFIPESQMTGAMVLVLKNLKPAAMRGVKSFGMVLCASNGDHTEVELLVPPVGSVPGDKVFFEGHEGIPDAQLNPKKKIFEAVQVDFKTGEDLVAYWKDLPFKTEKGVVMAKSLKLAEIK